MPPNHLHIPWTEAEEQFLRENRLPDGALALALNARFHKGNPGRSLTAVRFKRRTLGVGASKKPVLPKRVAGQQVEVTESGGERTLKSNSPHIKTVDDLLAYVEVDLDKFEVAYPEVSKYETTIRDEEGNPQVQQMFRIFVRLKPKANGLDVHTLVQQMIDGAFKPRKALPKPQVLPTTGLLQTLIIADPHIGKHAWAKETGHGDYDLDLACTTLGTACSTLMQDAGAVRHFFLIGDVFHYDTPSGTTTKGTPLERDGRVQKMIEMGSQVLCDVLEESAKQVPTVVTLVPGNHDAVLTWALQRILQSHFRFTKGLTIDPSYTIRKYHRWGKCLLGLTHGDKGHKLLPGLMAREAAVEWGQTTYREIHRGHLHYRKAIDTVEGVTIRQHPALCPPDAWHAGEGFVSDRGMESVTYHSEGAVVSTRTYSPDLGKQPTRGTR